MLTETPALLVYLAQAYPDARLAPLDDPFALARAQAFASYLCSTVHVSHAHLPRGTRWAAEPSSIEDMKRKTPANMRECFTLIETALFQGPWALGENYSFVDPYLYTVTNWLPMHGVDIAEFARVAVHFHRMGERESVRRALAAEVG